MARSGSPEPMGWWQRLQQQWQVAAYWCGGIVVLLMMLGMGLDFAVFPFQPPTQESLRRVTGRLADTYVRSAHTKRTSAENYEIQLEHSDQTYFVPPSVFPLLRRAAFEARVHPRDQVTLWVADVIEKPIDTTGWVLGFFRFAGWNWPGVLGLSADGVDYLDIPSALAAEASDYGDQRAVGWILLVLALAVPVVLGMAWLFGRRKGQATP